MPIPDNFTFSLDDVKTEVDDGDANDISSLSEAFSVSNDDGFDDTYDDVSGANTQSLKEFRNYDHNASGGGGGGGVTEITLAFTVTSFAQGPADKLFQIYTLGTVETPNNNSSTNWTINWNPLDVDSDDWIGIKVSSVLPTPFDYSGSYSGQGDNITIIASVMNNGETGDINRSVTFTVGTNGDTHTITQSGPAGNAAP